MYRILAWFLRAVSHVFFRQIEVVGLENIPATGGVVFAGNHPNSLIDPILIITTCGRKVHFAAKDALFRGRLMRSVLRGLGAVPIQRRHDHDGAPRTSPATASTPGATPIRRARHRSPRSRATWPTRSRTTPPAGRSAPSPTRWAAWSPATSTIRGSPGSAS